jgi:hypothetical protein
MRIFGVLALALIAFSCAGAAEAACNVNIIGEVKLTMEGREPLIDVEINGKPARLTVDTGAFGSLLFSGSLKDYGLINHERFGESFGVGGSARLGETTIPMMKLGTMTAGNLTMMVVAGRGGRSVGLIGADFLSQSDVEFDLAHGAVRFLRARGCKGDEELYWGGAYSQAPMLNSNMGVSAVVVRVLLNGHPFEAQLDTGAFESTVSTQAAAIAGGQPSSDMPPIYGGGIGAHRLITTVDRFSSFTFDQETARNPTLGVANLFGNVKVSNLGSRLNSDLAGTPDMLLGADFFLSHRVLVSYSQRMVYLTYSGGPIFDPIKQPQAKPPPPPGAPASNKEP